MYVLRESLAEDRREDARAEARREHALKGAPRAGVGPASPPVKFKTLRSEVEVTGVQTADERDEEAKKRAVDVDADDEPEAKRAK